MTNSTPDIESIRKRAATNDIDEAADTDDLIRACDVAMMDRNVLLGEVERLTREVAHHKLVNDILMRPTAGDVDEERQEVKSVLMTMAVRVMAAATRLNPAAKNYGAWMVGAEREPDGTEEPGSGEDIRGWEIHICCVRPGGKSPMVLATERGDDLESIRAALGNGADENLWPSGLTVAEAVERLAGAFPSPL